MVRPLSKEFRYNCGEKGHIKPNCPDLEEKPSGKKNAKAKYVRSNAKPTVKTQPAASTTEDAEGGHKRDVIIGESVKWAAKDYDASQCMEDSSWNSTVSGFADGASAQAEGFGTILLASMVDEELVFTFVEDVLYVPKAGCNLFSPGLALDQGFKMTWDQDSSIFGMAKDGIEIIRTAPEHRHWTFSAHNIGGAVSNKKKTAVKKQVVANFSVTDGVEDIVVWHERLGHTCPEYIRLMVDRSMAKGIMLKKRGKIDCADCHFGKQRRKAFRNEIDREIERVNDIVFADLLIPGLQNGTQYKAVLDIMDGYSCFVKTYLLTSRDEKEVNPRIQEYIAWAERQHGSRVDRVVTRVIETGNTEECTDPVRQVLTDKGQEICNGAIEKWFKKKGIVHIKVGPNASQLNPVERTHQTLMGMVKTMMHQSGLPPSFWTHALETAVYVKNRVFCKGAGRTPYELMFGSKPDIHHIRAFGSLTYCHTLTSKMTMNCRIGYVVGYSEDVVGCQVYFPTEHKRGFVSDVKTNEKIKYGDRYSKGFRMKVDKWLQAFNEFIEHGELDNLADEDNVSSQDAECDAESVRSAQSSNVTMEDADAVESASISSGEKQLWDDMVKNSPPLATIVAGSDDSLSDYEDVVLQGTQGGGSVDGKVIESDDGGADEEVSADDGQGVGYADEDEVNITVGDTCTDVDVDLDAIEECTESGEEDNFENDAETERVIVQFEEDSNSDLDDDDCEEVSHVTDLEVAEVDSEEEVDDYGYDYLLDPADKREAGEHTLTGDLLIGRRRLRDEEDKRTREPKRANVDAKRARRDSDPVRRLGLREAHERRAPKQFEDYQVYSAIKAMHVDRRGKAGIRINEVKIPGNYREAMRWKFAKVWRAAMDQEITVLSD